MAMPRVLDWSKAAKGQTEMSKETFVVAYDGSHSAVVDYAIKRARAASANLHIVHVLEWSPFAFLTPEEIEQRHAERSKELARAEKELLQPMLDRARAAGLEVSAEAKFGSPVSLLCDIAKQKNAEMMFVGRTGDLPLKERVFGSVAVGLAQASPVPLTIVP